MARWIKKILRKHFRVITLCVLSIFTVLIAMSTRDQPEAVPFGTYAFELEGAGPLANVSVNLDFQNNVYELDSFLAPGNYSIKSGMHYAVDVGGSNGCAPYGSQACAFQASRPSALVVRFNGSEMTPNGRFRFSFFNETDIDFRIELGDAYIFQGLYSVLPQGIHGEYSPGKDKVTLQTRVGSEKDSVQSEYVDFDLYSLNQTSHETNASNEWRSDYIITPLVMAMLLLLISDIIDYAHDYIKRKYRE